MGKKALSLLRKVNNDVFPFATPQEGAYLPPSAIRTIALRQLPGHTHHSVIFGQPGDAAKVIFYAPDPEFITSSLSTHIPVRFCKCRM